jgi:hypothetical protein
MTSRISTILVLSPLLLLAAPPEQAAAQCLAPGFGGLWRGNDGGTYRIRDLGTMIVWDGRSGDNGRSWINRFRGTRKGNVVTGEWGDVGKRTHGTLTIRMDNDHLLVRTASTGSPFGGTRWTRPVPSQGCNDTALIPAED